MVSAKKLGIVLCLTMLLSITVALPARAQTPTPPTPRDALTQAIEAQAQRDEQKGVQESTEGLNLLFGDQASQVGLTLPEVKQIYEDAYSVSAAARPWWQPYLPGLGWIAATLALLAAIFRGAIEDAGKKLVTSFWESLYNRFAGSKPFWRLALGRYKTTLYQKHHELKLPFRPGRPLPMKEIYVPVKVRERDQLTDAYQAIEKHKKLVVLGAPGAGKSILLRHVALTYAERDLDQPLVPLLVELNRLNEAGTNMFAHLAAILKQNDFPNGETFLKSWLKAGQLLLMFDGLDEVNTDRREQVSAAIRDLLAEYPGCHAIVTCRTQVYKGEFADWADQTLEVAEFSDQQIQRFLFAWQKELPPGKSVDHLWANLSERPRILALARNPLMLTIIAFLYADTEFVLPHSRAEFYDTAVTVLLEQWKEKRNRYKAASKRLVMRHLALFMQDTALEREQERRTIDLPVLLAEIKKALPALNLKDDEAQPILDEIVERSGLMIGLDGGLKYQFTHLTLQEFFAAQALGDDYQGLLRRFTADPDTWREVVKLWCGLEHDSTALLDELYDLDRQTALECLADAQEVDPALAEQLVNEFKTQILSDQPNDALLRSMANLTADPRPRGQALQKFLTETASNPAATPEQVETAAKVLALTSLPQVAALLVRLAGTNPNLQPFLATMGDRIVPEVEKLLTDETEWALDTLYKIGTPLAARALAAQLWDESRLAYPSAWRLAALIARPDIQEGLESFSLKPEQRKAKQIEWIWEPFTSPGIINLPAIAGRVAWLLHNTPEDQLPAENLPCAPELALPLCAIVTQDGRIQTIKDNERKEILKEKEMPGFVVQYRQRISIHAVWNRLFDSLIQESQQSLLVKLIEAKPQPDPNDWRNVQSPSAYQFKESGHLWLLKALFGGLALLNLVSIAWFIAKSPVSFIWGNSIALAIGILVLAGLWWTTRITWATDGIAVFIWLCGLSIGAVFGSIAGEVTGSWLVGALVGALGGVLGNAFLYGSPFHVSASALDGVLVGALVGALAGALGSALGITMISVLGVLIFAFSLVITSKNIIKKNANEALSEILRDVGLSAMIFGMGSAPNFIFTYYPTIVLYSTFGLPLTVAFWLTWIGSFLIVLWLAQRAERRAANPMHQFLPYLTNAPQLPRQKRSWFLDFLPSRLLRR